MSPRSNSAAQAQEDKWDEEIAEDLGQAQVERRLHEMAANPARQAPVKVDDIDEEKQEEALRPEIAAFIDLTAFDKPRGGRQRKVHKVRNLSIRDPNFVLNKCEHNDLLLKPGITVEIEPCDDLYKASFLMIQFIIQTPTGVKLRGLPMTRLRNLRGQLRRLRNELCLVFQLDADDGREKEAQGAIDIEVEKIVNIRDCHFTNADFPTFRFDPYIYKSEEQVEAKGLLMCRWKSIRIYKDAATRLKKGPPVEFILEHVREDEVPRSRFRLPPATRLNDWRGGKVRGGAYNPQEPNDTQVVINLDGDENVAESGGGWMPIQPGQQYTFGDMFCGAGGASLGARKAGFRIKLSCDHMGSACRTYKHNFPEATLYEEDIYDFIKRADDAGVRVDALHLSPPCQFWSPAHTVAGKNDEANVAALFSCSPLIKKLRPRVFTLEQTFGILSSKFEHYFNALVHGFTQYGYSVRWKVVHLQTWGLPARRQRLIMIGACPGEDLPPYPATTHSENPRPGDGTKRWVTVKQMLDKIPPDLKERDDMHNPAKLPVKNHAPWNPNVFLNRCITTNGGFGNYHPSGLRDFTQREYAVLQTFSIDYTFDKRFRKKQIGNAFPPMIVKALLKHIRVHLQEIDRVHSPENDHIDPDDPYLVVIHDVDEEKLQRARRAQSEGSDVVCTGSRPLRRGSNESSGSITVADSDTSPDEMDVDTSMDSDSPSFCIDPVQRRTWGVIDLEKED
ncbi:Uu.00g121450.m01.CDS01 [Anthostomella pinea]|uniref:DNA (cytosine-5-)-methyltransferase n=1 Tax=Anthostomella pinea TaxID=933095 RepID=A0AAI8VHP9_9PEZI|nr:Uu.00g121450.m01.CDS01 [Anthostomella pinea]